MLEPKHVQNIVEKHQAYLCHNATLIDIFQGNLLEYITKDMANQFSHQSFEQAMFRVCPINVLPKIIDKLTNIYQTAVLREVVDGSESDKELMNWYVEKFDMNSHMNCANELFNLNKSTLIYPYLHNGQPRLREILNDRFILYSDDPVDPTTPTHVIILYGKRGMVDLYMVYSATEFYVYGSDGRIYYDVMAQYGLDGINPYGRLPFVYVNESKYSLMPQQDTDVLKLTKLIPVMLTDLNFAAMYQCFSIIYGIDLDDENIAMAPNSFWRLKSDPTSTQKPELGMLKPQVDYDQVLNLVQSQLSMWLGTKGIKSSSVGGLEKDNFASGISKIIDEMDTFEARQKQVGFFINAEKEFWDLVLNTMHPYWAANGMIENKALFTPTASVKTSFAIQLPTQSRGTVVADLKLEYEAGFISRKRAVSKLNPDMNSEEIEELLEEIDEERSIDVSETEETPETEAQEAEEEVNGSAENQDSDT